MTEALDAVLLRCVLYCDASELGGPFGNLEQSCSGKGYLTKSSLTFAACRCVWGSTWATSKARIVCLDPAEATAWSVGIMAYEGNLSFQVNGTTVQPATARVDVSQFCRRLLFL